ALLYSVHRPQVLSRGGIIDVEHVAFDEARVEQRLRILRHLIEPVLLCTGICCTLRREARSYTQISVPGSLCVSGPPWCTSAYSRLLPRCSARCCRPPVRHRPARSGLENSDHFSAS